MSNWYLKPDVEFLRPQIPESETDWFEGSSVGAAWVWTNQGTSTASIIGGRLVLSAQASGAGTNLLRVLMRPVPTGNWTIVARVKNYSPEVNQGAGLCCYRTTSGDYLTHHTIVRAAMTTSPFAEMWAGTYWSDASTAVSNPYGALNVEGGRDVYFQMRYDGTSVYFDWSPDGVRFTNLASATTAATIGGAPTHFGFSTNTPVAATAGSFAADMFLCYHDANLNHTPDAANPAGSTITVGRTATAVNRPNPPALPTPPKGYDARDQREFRRQVMAAITQIDVPTGLALPGITNVKDYGVTLDGTTDDRAALQAALDAIKAAGGGVAYIGAGTLKITGTVTVDRKVCLWGAGAQLTSIKSDGTERALQVVGADSKWIHEIRGLMFDGVRVEYGPTPADWGGKGAVLQDCEISNCTKGVKYIYNCFVTCIDRCRIHNCTDGVYFDLATAGSGSGAAMKVTNSDIFNCTNGVQLYGNTTDGHNILITACDIEHCAASLKVTDPGGRPMEGSIHLTNCHFELNTVNLIENNGSHVFVDHFWALSGTEDYSFKCTAGTIHVANARMTRGRLGLCHFGAGYIYFEPDNVFIDSHVFGSGGLDLSDTGSTGTGWGMVGRNAFTGWFDVSRTMTNAAPGTFSLAEIGKFDGNRYTWEFDFACTTAGATDNVLLILCNPGGVTYVNLALPLSDGRGHCWLELNPDGNFSMTAYYVIAATGVASTYSATSATVAATNGITIHRYLDFKSDKAGATAATITITNFRGQAHGYIKPGI